MGSVLNNDNLLGLNIWIRDDVGTWTSCPTIDGSGFYDCKASGRYIELKKPVLGSEVTICEVAFYSEKNIITSVDPGLS